MREIYNIRVKVQQMAKQGQCDAQNVLDILATAFEKDQHASGGVTVDEEDNLAVLYYQSLACFRSFLKYFYVFI